MCERACALAKCLAVDRELRLAKLIRPWDCTGCKACERACPYSCIIVLSDENEVPLRAKVTIQRVWRYARKPIIVNNPSLVEIAKAMHEKKIGSVLAPKRLIATETDVLNSFINGSNKVEFKEAITINERFTLSQALDLMLEKGISHLPIVDDREDVTGVISLRDCLRGLAVSSVIKHSSLEIHALKGERKISDFLFMDPVVLESNSTLREAVTKLLKEKRKAGLVIGEKPGVFTLKDGIRMISEGKGTKSTIEVRYDTPILDENESVSKALSIMEMKGIRHIVIRTYGGDYNLLSIREISKGIAWVVNKV
jgi:predicted transcriptional regulator